MIHEFRRPIPVVVEGGKEGYALYVTDNGTFEDDFWCVVHCEGGIVRHYRSDQIRVHASGTLGITKDPRARGKKAVSRILREYSGETQ